MDVKDLGSILGALNPELQKAADRVAMLFPADSFFRSENADRLFGVLSDAIEKNAKKMSFPLGDIVEKSSDFIEFLSRSLRENKAVKPISNPSQREEMKKKFEEIFLKQVAVRLRQAPNPAQLGVKIKAELDTLMSLLDEFDAREAKKIKREKREAEKSAKENRAILKAKEKKISKDFRKIDAEVASFFNGLLKNW